MKILFVYNADSGMGNLLLDVAHKLISPKTYACNLCSITHHAYGRRNDFREFIEKLPYPVDFLHRDEYEQRYSGRRQYPFVSLMNSEGDEAGIIEARQINMMKDFDQLRAAFESLIENISVA